MYIRYRTGTEIASVTDPKPDPDQHGSVSFPVMIKHFETKKALKQTLIYIVYVKEFRYRFLYSIISSLGRSRVWLSLGSGNDTVRVLTAAK